MQLNALPAEVLSILLARSNSFIAVDLWKCGDRLLNEKLAIGVLELDLQEVRDVAVVRRLPGCIKHFRRLRSSIITFSGIHALSRINGIRKAITEWTSDLLHLEMHFCNAQKLLLEGHPLLADGSHITLQNTDQLDEMSMEKAFSTSIDGVWSLRDVFPRLETLCLSGGLTGPKFMSDLHLWLLPRTLTRLSLQLPTSNSLHRDLRGLPKTLTDLSLSDRSISADAIRSLPVGIQLRKVNATSLAEDARTLLLREHEKWFPHLEVFALPETTYNDAAAMKVALEHGSWPLNLLTLLFIQTPASQVFEIPLPPRLTELSISRPGHGDVPMVDGEFLRAGTLPPTLKQLTVPEIDWSAVSAELWPPGLASIVSHWHSELFGAFHKLPRSLTAIKMLHLPAKSHLQQMPLNSLLRLNTAQYIEHLKKMGRRMLKTLDNAAWTAIKAEYETSRSRHSIANLQAVEAGWHFGLPLSLRSFIAMHASSEGEPLLDFSVPPRTELVSTPFNRVERLLTTIPPSTKELVILAVRDWRVELAGRAEIEKQKEFWSRSEYAPTSASSGLSPSHSAVGSHVQLSIIDELHTLLPNLTTLRLSGASFWVDLIPCLPRSLTTLIFRAVPSGKVQRLEAEALRDLPANLEVLALHGHQLVPTDNWASFLPQKSLKDIELAGSDIYGPDMLNLPSAVTNLSVHDAIAVTVPHLRQLRIPKLKLSAVNLVAPVVEGRTITHDVNRNLILRTSDLRALRERFNDFPCGKYGPLHNYTVEEIESRIVRAR